MRHKSQQGLWPTIVEVIKEDAAYPPTLAAVSDVKVLVTPLFEARVKRHAMLVAYVFVQRVKMPGIFLEKVGRRQIRPPPNHQVAGPWFGMYSI